MIKTTKRKLLENKSSIARVRNETDHENNELFTYMCVCACVCVSVCVCLRVLMIAFLILPLTVVFIKVT